MSSFICSDRHIGIIALKVSDYFGVDCRELANKLKRINIASVNYRYNERTRFSQCKFNTELDYSAYSNDDIAALIQCLDFQSCEENSAEYKAFSSLLAVWILETKANRSNSQLWSI